MRRLFAILCLVLLFGSAGRSQIVPLVPGDGPIRILVPLTTVNSAWRQNAYFDDAAWMNGTGGAGYDDSGLYAPWIGLNLKAAMVTDAAGSDRTAMMRARFTVTEAMAAASQSLTLKVRYDDGFTAFLNGRRIADANAPPNARYNSRATAGHEAGAEPAVFDITASVPELAVGTNLLALQGFNAAPGDPDFLLWVSLELDTTPPPPVSSNLPLVCVRTRGRSLAPEVRTTVDLSVIDRGPGVRNWTTDPPNVYSGPAAMEIRGQSSSGYPKKSYNLETRNADGTSRNVPLLGFPRENDWVLYGPYVDRSLMRNALLYRLSNRMGRYASRTRFCELVLNGRPRGVYVLMEKIKRDRNRVAVAELNADDTAGDALTGGYIVKIDKPGNDFFMSSVPPWPGAFQRVSYQYHDPADDVLRPEQKAYISGFIREFETAMNGPDAADPENGWACFIDADAFADHFILNEISKNVDGYRLSAFFSKERDSRGGKLAAGPVWDMDLGVGNADYYGAEGPGDWQIDNLTSHPQAMADNSPPPFFWKKLLEDPAFRSRVRVRWQSLRKTVLATESVLALVDAMADTLAEAQARNFGMWPGPGERGEGFWPVPAVFYSFRSYRDEINYLKYWLSARFDWMDEAIASFSPDSGLPGFKPESFGLEANYPNPFNAATTIRFSLASAGPAEVTVFDVIGRRVRTLVREKLPAGPHALVWDGFSDSGEPTQSGVYVYSLQTADRTISKKMILMK
ncbi:MAG: CotH kinase family protein [bacterium]|nr:CotH kinase family protein [bacterium]